MKPVRLAATLAIWLAIPLAAQISPGPLTRAHQQLEGVTKCAQCHDFGAGKRVFKCLDCHTEIRRRVDARIGFHGRAYKPSVGQTDCARCHMEHNGRGFALIRLDRETFDHAAQTGFVLEGTHHQQKCEACHNDKRIDVGARAEIKVKDLNHTFLGLRRECLSCHQDRHQGQLGNDCARCHSQQAWKPVTGFNHIRTNFPLTGLHQAVACLKCHATRSGEEALRFKGLSFSGCQSCHTDPHRGAFQEARFNGSCETCHNTNGWKNNRPSTTFHHDTTRFPLLGKHAELHCPACHKSSDFRKPIAHARCQDCHEDTHRGQFATRAAGADCAACHRETGFAPSRFDTVAHNGSAFPLAGKHAALACVKCHQPAGRSAVYMTGKLVCSACHEDRHSGQFAGPPYGNRCDLCHTAAGFQPATFTTARHQETRFPLTGKHAAVACRDCHRGASEPRQYHLESRNCAACHADPHQTDPHQTKVSCESCHTTEQWKAVRAFDHATTNFRLEGAHQTVTCIQCHVASVKTAPGFSGTQSRCSACHAKTDPHGGQFLAANREEDCAACHNPVAWKLTTFDHDKARFPLDVAHRNVACGRCHKEANAGLSKSARMYRGTSTECVQCH